VDALVATERQESAGSAARAAKRGAEAHDWSWAEASVWTQRMVSALENGVKGGRWYSLMDKVYAPATLQAAFAKVRANRGAAGVDGVSVERFAARSETYLAELSTALREASYRPQPVRRVDIPKGDGRTRPLGIPAVKDRIVQTAVKLVIEPIFEATFCAGSYGFRPGRGCRDALREVDRLIGEGFTFVVDADLAGYFDSIPHERLMQRVGERISDGRMLALLRGFLEADILRGMERWTPVAGTPQGAVISPLLANIYLDPLDARMAARGYSMVRYADDFVVLCHSREEAEAALMEIRRWVAENGLALHPDKTQIGDCRQPGQGFDFLGYRFEAGKRWVRKKSLARFKDGIRAKTRRTRGNSLARIVADLNPLLRGWFGYFKHAHRATFPGLDGFVRRRLRALLRKQLKRPGSGRSQADHQRWPNHFFADAGLFALDPAWHAASHSR
jgi:RNA-directed DNA polymerase